MCQSEKGKVGICRVDGRGFSDGPYQNETLHSSGQVSDSKQRNEDGTFNVYPSILYIGMYGCMFAIYLKMYEKTLMTFCTVIQIRIGWFQAGQVV